MSDLAVQITFDTCLMLPELVEGNPETYLKRAETIASLCHCSRAFKARFSDEGKEIKAKFQEKFVNKVIFQAALQNKQVRVAQAILTLDPRLATQRNPFQNLPMIYYAAQHTENLPVIRRMCRIKGVRVTEYLSFDRCTIKDIIDSISK